MTKIFVQTVTPEPVTSFVELENTFAFRADKPHQWLQKLCFAVLKKLGASKIHAQIEYKESVIDTEKILDRILQSQEALRRIYHDDIRYIILGIDEYRQFDLELFSSYYFEMPRFELKNGREVKVFRGLIVVLVPWMQGFTFLPELPPADYGSTTHSPPSDNPYRY